MKIGDLLLVGLVLIVLNSFIFARIVKLKETIPNDDYKKYCTDNGGVIINNIVSFGTFFGYVDGYDVDFCEIVQSGNLGMIGIETLASTKPSLAATYIKNLTIDSEKRIKGPFSQPATNLCYALGGACINYHVDGGFYDDRGFSGVCFFGDGSHIATWTLYYIGVNSRNDIKNLVRAEPLAINIPDIY